MFSIHLPPLFPIDSDETINVAGGASAGNSGC